MKIKTKYNIGDEVWCRDFEGGRYTQSIQVKIYCILVNVLEGKVKIDYRCSKNDDSTLVVEEKYLFSFKEEMVKRSITEMVILE